VENAAAAIENADRVGLHVGDLPVVAAQYEIANYYQ
jgi:hypothetical protein